MKLQFKHQTYQADAVRALVYCFKGQPKSSGLKYVIDPGAASPQDHVPQPGTEAGGFANTAILKKIRELQRGQRIPVSDSLKVTDT